MPLARGAGRGRGRTDRRPRRRGKRFNPGHDGSLLLLPHLAPGAFLGSLSSEVVGQPYHGLAHYAASKAALEELVRALRVEHPAFRFSCIRVGATPDTDFARDFSPELAAELTPQWIARAKLPATFMTAHEVGASIAGAVGIAFASPSVDVQDLTLRPPEGPMMVGGLEDVAGMIAEVSSGVEQG